MRFLRRIAARISAVDMISLARCYCNPG